MPFSKRTELPEPETLDDDVIRNKIQEANQLIDRVRRALGKIKAIKSGSQSEDGESGVSKSASTDIEETLKNLKDQTAQLITDDNEDSYLKTEQKSKCFPTTAKTDGTFINNTLNKTFIKEERSGSCNENTNLIATTPAVFEETENVRNRPDNCDDKCSLGKNIALDRPKTRRNETDDDLSDQLRKDKFRSYPEYGRLEVSSSFEELQEKLKTISETTESYNSTPRKKSIDPITDQNCKYCNTDQLKTENKGIQVAPAQNTTGVGYNCLRENKCIQATAPRALTKNVTVESISPRRMSLEAKSLPPQDVSPTARKCTTCQAEHLPIVELLSPCRKYVCEKCKKNLKEEHLGSISIPSKLQKLEKLKVQALPSIIIQQTMTLTQVLNFSINPYGECENRVKNVQNILFFELKHVNNNQKGSDGDDNQTIVDYKYVENEPDLPKGTIDDLMAVPDTANVDENQKSEMSPTYRSCTCKSENDSEEMDLKETSNQFFEKLKKDYELEPKKLTPEEEEELYKKLWYKSYHIYDNPNKHDPGQLGKKSMEKVSQMDFDFYKTFINPNTALPEVYFTPSETKHKIAGFESKTIQCDESMFMSLADLDSSKEDTVKRELQQSKPFVSDMESEVTLLHVKVNKPDKIGPKQSSVMFISNQAKFEADYKDSDETPSEITVTISYTSSSDEGLTDITGSKRSISKIHESEIKTTNLDYEPDAFRSMTKSVSETKELTAADKCEILKLQEKLKNIDTKNSDPQYSLTRNYTLKENYPKGSVNVSQKENDTLQESQLSDVRETERQQALNNVPSKDEPSLHNPCFKCIQLGANNHHECKAKPSNKHHTVNYVLNKQLTTFENSFAKHLERGQNGRYKDEEHLFTQVPYPTIGNFHNNKEFPQYRKELDSKQLSFQSTDKELARNKFQEIPRHRLKRYSPDTSNSDTVTTNSISEGEIRCKHSISNGEIHVCRHRPQCPHLPRTILTRRNFSYSPTFRSPRSFPCSLPKKFDLNDPKVTIEQRRNYFNNWVTYYVRPQDVNESSTSSCSNNK